jgi:hypothetical protein
MIRKAIVTVRLDVTMPDGYTGQIEDDVEQDVRYALAFDVNSTLGEAEFEVVDVTTSSIEDDDEEEA